MAVLSMEANGVNYQKLNEIISKIPVKPVDNYKGNNIYLKIEILYEAKKVRIFNSYKIKDILKKHGFTYNPDLKSWDGGIFNFFSVSEFIWEYIPNNIRYYIWANGGNNRYTRDINSLLELESLLQRGEEETIISNAREIYEKCTEYLNKHFNFLYHYQREGIEKILKAFLNKASGFILEDEQGLGKTIQALAFAALIKDILDKNSTIIYFTKNALVQQVYKEAIEFLPESCKKYISLFHNVTERGKINIISYSKLIARKVYPLLSAVDYDYVILDECHVLKSTKSKTGKNLKKIINRNKFILAMTGTLVKNRPADAYNIMKMTKLYDKNLAQFILQFEGEESFYYTVRGYKSKYYLYIDKEKANNLRQYLTSTGCYLRRKKEEVLDFLPAKQRLFSLIEIEESNENREILRHEKEILKQMVKKGQLFRSSLKPEEAVKISLYRKQIGLIKVPYIAEYINEYLYDEKRLIIFVHHNEVVEALEAKLKETNPGVEIIKIYGKSTKEDRQSAVLNFMSEDESKKWLILSFGVGAEGLTLTKANVIVFGEIDWSPSTMVQAEDRIHRISQTKKCIYHYIIASETLDAYINNVLERKQEYV